ncbi:MAG: hypothetical protein JJU00_12005 [Opitutales bacterium]|nr:hypothetical protein [Opitutales bacterium]
MLSRKAKGLFIEVGEFSVQVAKTTSLTPPCAVESVESFSLSGAWERLSRLTEEMSGTGSGGKLVQAHCAVYPPSRFVRRHTVESAAKAKDPAYLGNVLSQQFKIDTATNVAAVLNAVDGSEFTLERSIAQQKELVFAGSVKAEFDKLQESLTDADVYPVSLQLGTLSVLGGISDYIRWKQISDPVMVIEMSMGQTCTYIVSRNMVELARPLSKGLSTIVPRIREELGLKDEASAEKLFLSNTFDFTEMGPALLQGLLKELQAAIGFFEVQTGMTIGHLHLGSLPENLSWIPSVMSKSLGLRLLRTEYGEWLPRVDVQPQESVLEQVGGHASWFGLFSMMGAFNSKDNGSKKK